MTDDEKIVELFFGVPNVHCRSWIRSMENCFTISPVKL